MGDSLRIPLRSLCQTEAQEVLGVKSLLLKLALLFISPAQTLFALLGEPSALCKSAKTNCPSEQLILGASKFQGLTRLKRVSLLPEEALFPPAKQA